MYILTVPLKVNVKCTEEMFTLFFMTTYSAKFNPFQFSKQ